MHIVLLNQFFWPDTVATAQLLSDVAQALGQENEVTAICSSALESGPHASSALAPKLAILRTHGFHFSHRSLSRIASYVSYIGGAIWHGMRLSGVDVYLTLTTPPLLSVIGSGLVFLRGGRHLIWEMDVYPDIASDIGYFKRGGIADWCVGAMLDWSRRRASAIIVLGEEMKSRLVGRGVPEDKVHIVENWADGREIRPQSLGSGPFVVEYSGNLGHAHEIDTVVAVIERLRNDPNFRFVFAGGGPKRQKLEAVCREKGIRNVDFKPYCRRTELGASLGEGHLGLVTQLPQTLGSVVPSKIYGIMAAGRPILYIGPGGSTPAEHIRRFNCGWHITPGDVNSLERLLVHLNSNRHLVSEAGERARVAFEQNFDRWIAVERILRVIGSMDHSTQVVPIAVGD